MSEVEDVRTARHEGELIPKNIEFRTFEVMREVLSRPVDLFRSALLGVFVARCRRRAGRSPTSSPATRPSGP